MNFRSLQCLIFFVGITQIYSEPSEPITTPKPQFLPIVLWHGMGDSCCFPFSLGAISKMLQESMPNIYVLSLMIGKSIPSDVENGFFMHPNKQVEQACEIIKSDPQLADGYNAIGFSQGAQFLRALVQRCDGPKVRNLISVGGQHQGVYGLPNCPSLSHYSCDYIRRLLNHAAYYSWVQNSLVQATYWHDPLNEKEYKKGSTFLANINNEMTINDTYIERLKSLENFVMIKFDNDTMVQPIASEWFGFYEPGQSKQIQTLQESDIYIKNRLGLKDMNAVGKLHFLSVEGNHLQFKWPWFEENVIEPFLK